MPNTRPKVFVSAASGDLRTMRGIVKDALLTIGCHPIEQTHFPPDDRSTHNMLRDKISDCQALVHIVGLRYGTEPNPDALPPGTPRRSYTQLEYHIGRELQRKRGDRRFRVYVFVCPEDFPYDAEADSEAEEKRELQRQHRRAILKGEFIYEEPADEKVLTARIHALREEVLHLQAKQKQRQRLVWSLLTLLLAGIAGGGYALYRNLPARTAEAVVQTLDAEAIAARLRADINARFAHDAGQARRQQQNWLALRELERNRDMALARVDDVVATIKEGLAGNPDPIFREASRIVEQEGADAALAYLESHQSDLLARADRAAAQAQAPEDKLHQVLKPMLLQAATHCSRDNFKDRCARKAPQRFAPVAGFLVSRLKWEAAE